MAASIDITPLFEFNTISIDITPVATHQLA